MLFPWRIDSKPLLTTDEMIGKSKPVLNDLGFLPLAAEAFLDMRSDAEKDGIGISPVSVYRSFSAQMNIWNKKYMALSLEPEKRIRQIIRYTAIPGTSRHHWGTDADLIDAKNLL
ncbi:MAG: D-alanyl-D-alanine carboxypeptidase family protein [Candidatus Aenigmatarchaeota archaeon]